MFCPLQIYKIDVVLTKNYVFGENEMDREGNFVSPVIL